MTRQEAIDTLRANYPDKCYESLRNAVDVAIKALEAEPELTDEIIAAHEKIGYKNGRKDGYAEALEAESKHGKWIDTPNYYQRWKCSLCGCHTRDAVPNYCPNCGARMDGGEDD